RRESIEHRRARHERIARILCAYPRQKHRSAHGADADASEQEAVGLGTPLELLADDEREQCPGRAREDEERSAADEHGLERRSMAEEAEADAYRRPKALRGQSALLVLALPAEEHDEDPDIGERIQREDKPRTCPRDERTRDGGSDCPRDI